MTKQTMTALVSAALFVAFAIALAIVPVPFVVLTPGSTIDVLGQDRDGRELIELDDIPVYSTGPGRLAMTTVAVTRADGSVGVPEAVFGYFLPRRETMPRSAFYREGTTVDQVRSAEAAQMSTSQDAALVAALRADGHPVQDRAMVVSVTKGGPADGVLAPGDMVLKIGGKNVTNLDAVRTLVRTNKVGATVPFQIVRGGRELDVEITLGPANDNPADPVIGVAVGPGYSVTPQVTYNIDPQIGGPSAGLVFALAIYDKITPGPLFGNMTIAGTGQIDPVGNVMPIGGVQEKIAAAEAGGASAFLVPADNCPDAAGMQTRLILVQVTTLSDAIVAVRDLGSADTAGQVPRC